MTEPNPGDLIVSGGKALLASIIRTLVPVVVGAVVAVLTKWGVPVEDETVTSLVNGLVLGGTALAYYVIARIIEVGVNSNLGGALLGWIKSPVYLAKELRPTVIDGSLVDPSRDTVAPRPATPPAAPGDLIPPPAV
jgi:tetrahydromethanopterin S-methyltransferase subunit C